MTANDRSDAEYAEKIAGGLDQAFADPATERLELDLDDAKLVIFSDHHKGTRDGADDFQRCEGAYNAALGYYFETGYRLFVLGDVEELWENPPGDVLASYEETLRLEAKFHEAGRYERFWGNHDDLWRAGDDVSERLHRFFPKLRVREALKLEVVAGGERLGVLFLAHGHQGTLESDRFAWFSRAVVRHVWRPLQRRVNFASTTPARDYNLRERHDAAMFDWARKHDPPHVLIAGHTHRPVFWTSTPPTDERSEEQVKQELDELRNSGSASPEALGKLQAELEFIRADERRRDRRPITIDPPCYFNTGCCSFGDGDVTGIEIADGEIRLVRWPNDDDEPLPKILTRADMREVLEKVPG